MTKIEIIKETKRYYEADTSRRGFHDFGNYASCFYIINDGKMCAVGRCLLDPHNIPNESINDIFINYTDLNKSLKPEYRGHDIGFWKELQKFHDGRNNWDEDGLTMIGKGHYQRLLEIYEGQ